MQYTSSEFGYNQQTNHEQYFLVLNFEALRL